jgi:peroxin-7
MVPASHKRGRIPFSGHSVKFSPFRPNLIAVASSQYFGIAGNGRISILDSQNNLASVCEFGTRDACFDVAFSEQSETIVAGACGDGAIRIFDLHRPGDRPVAALCGHSAETYSVDWNLGVKTRLCSASWDKSVRLWDLVAGKEVGKYQHGAIAYEAKWNTRNPSLVASVGGDGHLKVMDTRDQKVLSLAFVNTEILSLDWNKYRDTVIATGSVDRNVCVWDIRNAGKPLCSFTNHQLAVRRVRFNPHSDSLLLSCSYDMSVKLWSVSSMTEVDSFDHHTEFVIGIDFCNFERDLVASASWDRSVALWTLGTPKFSLPPMRRPQTFNRVSNI